MASNFPTSLDDATSLVTTRTTGNAIPASDHNDLGTSTIAVETKVGIGASTPTTGQYLKGTGTGVSAWGTIASGDVPTLNQDTTGKAAKADALNSATTVVNVSAATAPTTGQVLTATGGTAATWQTPAGGGGGGSSVYFGYHGSGSVAQAVTANTVTPVKMDTQDFDSGGGSPVYSTTTGKFTVPTGKAGVFCVIGALGSENGGLVRIGFRVNGASGFWYVGATNYTDPNGHSTVAAGTTMLSLADGDYVEIVAYTAMNTTIDGQYILPAGSFPTYFQGYKIA